jgi:hypothetical protein
MNQFIKPKWQYLAGSFSFSSTEEGYNYWYNALAGWMDNEVRAGDLSKELWEFFANERKG